MTSFMESSIGFCTIRKSKVDHYASGAIDASGIVARGLGTTFLDPLIYFDNVTSLKTTLDATRTCDHAGQQLQP